ncbi:MAG: HAD family hydrolase [Victivallaceae bacterium]
MHNRRFKGIIFDMDGTLTVPVIDFDLIRRKLGVTDGDIVEVIASWPEAKRRWAWNLIELYEEEVCNTNQLQPGVEAALHNFQLRGIKLGIITRNTRKSSDILLRRMKVNFDVVLTREYPFIKPAPEPVLHILEKWQIKPEECLMIGDYIHDIMSARAAGAVSCYFKNPDSTSWEKDADYTVQSYCELEALVFGEENNK